MNGRIYDAKLARFLQADPFIQAAGNTQSYNRYSYTFNNPLNATDPSGFVSRWNKFIHAWGVHKFLNKHALWAVPIIQVALNFIPFAGPYVSAAFGANNAYYLSGGNDWAAIKSYGTSMATMYAFNQVGKAFDGQSGGFWQQGGAGHVFTHAMVGGVLSVVQGGKFGHGFASAGLTKAFMSHSGFDYSKGDLGDIAGRTTIAAIVGGTISEITGGKFANGAITAAMAHLFNAEKSAAEARKATQYRVTGTDSVNGRDHSYSIRGLICNESTEGCNGTYADKIFAEVNQNDVPFGADSNGAGYKTLMLGVPLIGNQPIYHSEDIASRQSVNVTVEGHQFHPGSVTHSVFFENGNLYYQVLGVGTGATPGVNNFVGAALFAPGVTSIVRKYGM
jgi:hypothetical protein